VPKRLLTNWLEAYLEYASSTEAPKIIHFWAAVSAIAGALRRRVWFDQIKFKWYPSFYIVIVGPPGIITKSTTADGSMDLLKRVPGIHFGPDAITWQALVSAFADSAETVEWPPGEYTVMSPVTYLASEFGNLINFEDKDMINLLITLWDGRNTYSKETKHSGSDMVEGPWINIIACTTPRWIDDNMSANVIGGGFTSRCVFVYGDRKEKKVAYIKNQIADMKQYDKLKDALVHDLEHIASKIIGPYELTPEAEVWGEAWYQRLWDEEYKLDNEDYVNNYLARKQAHMHKLAIVIAAAKRDERIITQEDLHLAEIMLNTTESDFRSVFSRVGRTEEARQADTLLNLIRVKKELPYTELVRLSQTHFPNSRDLEGIMKSFIDAKWIRLAPGTGNQTWVVWTGEEPVPT
jgi:hypothetical protein